MSEFTRAIRAFFKGADLLLLMMGLATSGFGLLLLSSTARPLEKGVMNYLVNQSIGIFVGIVLFIILTAIDMDFLVRFWKWILGFNVIFLALIIPFGFGGEETGNKSWIRIPGVPMSIQPAEIVKITFIILLAAQMYRSRDKVSGLLPVGGYVAHLGLMAGLIIIPSGDVGVALIYVFVFLCMFLAAGVKMRWFAIGGVAVTAALPLLWNAMLSQNMQERILITLNPNADPYGKGYQMLLSMRMISSGQITGQGLYQGRYTQSGDMFAGHCDFAFASCGEELGFFGCVFIILMLALIVIRCLVIAHRARNGMGALICVGVAGMFFFQTFLNIAMCLSLAPVIGITLPFISYGGSSIIASFAALGLVSSVKMRPKVSWYDH